MDPFTHIYTLLAAGESLVVATIVASSGSTPRQAGTRMVIGANSSPEGTIGGGAVEHQVVVAAEELLVSRRSVLLRFNFNDPRGEAGIELICGGQVEILLEYVPATKANCRLYLDLVNSLAKGEDAELLGRIFLREGGRVTVTRALRTASGTWEGDLEIGGPLRELLADPRRPKNVMVDRGQEKLLVERLVPNPKLVLLGAGHVARDLGRLAAEAGFQLVVVDDREEFASKSRFPFAQETLVCDSWDEPLAGKALSGQIYVVIATRGHGFDRQALNWALGSGAVYIGMIGSRKKRGRIYQDLIEAGHLRTRLEEVHCPVGIAIEAQTPFEIAVSIVAELIAHRAGLERKS